MKVKNDVKFSVIILIICSLICTIYLQVNASTHYDLLIQNRLVELNLQETNYLPDVKLVKELLNSLFNVVNVSI